MQMIDHPATAWICVFSALALYTAALGRALREKTARRGFPVPALLPAGIGLLCAKAGYEVLQPGELASIFRWCMTTGLAGMLLGTFLAARRTGQEAGRLLDRMAPFLCLSMALVRLSQRWLGEVGAGPWMEEGTLLCRPPFVLLNEWEEALLAVFVPEALAALLGALAAVLHAGKGRGNRAGIRYPGGTAVLAVLFLTIPQMMLEQFRTGHYMHWRMVRAEQVLCVLTALSAVLLFRRRGRKMAGIDTRDVFPGLLAVLLMCAVIALAQFVLDGKLFDWPEAVCWLLYGMAAAGMLAACCVMVLRGERPTEADPAAGEGDEGRCESKESV